MKSGTPQSKYTRSPKLLQQGGIGCQTMFFSSEKAVGQTGRIRFRQRCRRSCSRQQTAITVSERQEPVKNKYGISSAHGKEWCLFLRNTACSTKLVPLKDRRSPFPFRRNLGSAEPKRSALSTAEDGRDTSTAFPYRRRFP